MSNHYFAINRGAGLKANEVTVDTSSTAAADIELRVADGASLSRYEVLLALEKLELFLQNPQNASLPWTP